MAEFQLCSLLHFKYTLKSICLCQTVSDLELVSYVTYVCFVKCVQARCCRAGLTRARRRRTTTKNVKSVFRFQNDGRKTCVCANQTCYRRRRRRKKGDVLQMCFVGLNREWVQSGKTMLKSVGGILFRRDVELLLIQLTEFFSTY